MRQILKASWRLCCDDNDLKVYANVMQMQKLFEPQFQLRTNTSVLFCMLAVDGS